MRVDLIVPTGTRLQDSLQSHPRLAQAQAADGDLARRVAQRDPSSLAVTIGLPFTIEAADGCPLSALVAVTWILRECVMQKGFECS